MAQQAALAGLGMQMGVSVSLYIVVHICVYTFLLNIQMVQMKITKRTA